MSFFGGVEQYIHDYGYAAVSVGILLEDFGLPTPGETLLISGAIAAAHGTLSIVPLLLLAWLGAVVGDFIGWMIGFYGGHRLVVRYGGKVGVTAEKLLKVEGFFNRYGDMVIVFARFVVVLRQLNGIVAGTLEMHWARFLALNALGAALWVGWWGLVAYFLGQQVLDFIHAAGRIEPILLGVAAIVLLGLAAHIWWRSRR